MGFERRLETIRRMGHLETVGTQERSQSGGRFDLLICGFRVVVQSPRHLAELALDRLERPGRTLFETHRRHANQADPLLEQNPIARVRLGLATYDGPE